MIDSMEGRISRVEGIFEQMAQRLNSVDGRLSGIDLRITGLEQKVDAKFNVLVTIMASSWVTIMLAVVFHR